MYRIAFALEDAFFWVLDGLEPLAPVGRFVWRWLHVMVWGSFAVWLITLMPQVWVNMSVRLPRQVGPTIADQIAGQFFLIMMVAACLVMIWAREAPIRDQGDLI